MSIRDMVDICDKCERRRCSIRRSSTPAAAAGPTADIFSIIRERERAAASPVRLVHDTAVMSCSTPPPRTRGVAIKQTCIRPTKTRRDRQAGAGCAERQAGHGGHRAAGALRGEAQHCHGRAAARAGAQVVYGPGGHPGAREDVHSRAVPRRGLRHYVQCRPATTTSTRRACTPTSTCSPRTRSSGRSRRS